MLNLLVAIGDDLVPIYLLRLFRLRQIKGGILDTAINCIDSVESVKVMAEGVAFQTACLLSASPETSSQPGLITV